MSFRMMIRTAVASMLVVSGLALSPATAATVAPPKNFKITLRTSTQMNLSWSAVSGADSYTVRYSTSSSMSSPSYRVPTATNVRIENMKKNTKYYFQIRARKSGKDISDWSAKISGWTTNYAFSPPSKPSMSGVRSNGFKIAWGEVPNASRYRIQMATKSDWSDAVYLYSKNTTNSMWVGSGAADASPTWYPNDPTVEEPYPTNLIKPNTTYYIRARALEAKADDDGNVYNLTDYSSTGTVKTHASWTANPVADLQVAESSADGFTLTFQDVYAQTQFSPRVKPDSYRVQYWQTSATKKYLNTHDMDAATGSVSGVGGGGTVTLKIKKFCNSAAGADSCAAFAPGKSYYFRISSYKGGVNVTDYTASSGVRGVASDFTLASPGDVSVDQVTDTQVKLSWNQVAGASSYRLQQKYNSTSGTARYLYDICDTGTAPKFACTTSGGRVSVTLPKFTDNNTGATSAFALGKSYYYRVSAQSGASGTPGIEDRKSDYSPNYAKATMPGWLLPPPTGIARVTSTGSTVTLKWDQATRWDGTPYTGSVRYRLQVASEPDMSGSKTYPVTPIYSGVHSPELKVTGLRAETTYYFRVRVVDTNNSGTYSDYVERALTARTSEPTGSVAVGLDSVSGCSPDDYNLVAYNGSDLVNSGGPTSVSGNSAEFKLSDLPAASYKFHLAYYGTGNCVSPWVSNSANADDESHVLKVEAPTYAVSSASTRTIAQRQKAKAGVKVAGIVKRPNGDPIPYVAVSALAGPEDGTASNPNHGYRELHSMDFSTVTGFSLQGLWPNKKYKLIYVSGNVKQSVWYDHVTASNPGTNLTVTLTGDSSPPDQGTPGDGYEYVIPSNLRSTGQTPNSLAVAWNAVTGAPHYRVQYSKNANMSGAQYADTTGTSLTLSGLAASTKYYFRVAVVEAGNGGKLSDYTQTPYPSATTKASSTGGSPGYAYAIPTNLRSTAPSSTSLKLDWDPVSGAPEYRVQYSKNANMSGAKYASTTGTSLTLSGLSASTNYYVRVAVVEAGNGGKLSDYTGTPYPLQRTTAGTFTSGYGYAIPGNLRSTAPTSNSLTVSWNAVSGAPHYRVQYSKNANMSGAQYADTTGTSLSLSGLSANTTYYLRVAVVGAGNGGKLSDYTQQAYPTGKTS